MIRQRALLIIVIVLGLFIDGHTDFREQEVLAIQDNIEVRFPERPLANHAFQIGSSQDKSFMDWTSVDHLASLATIRKIIKIWEDHGIADQYAIYGQQRLGENKAFSWEIVPYSEPSNDLIGKWKVFWVLCKNMFGAPKVPAAIRQQFRDIYHLWWAEKGPISPSEVDEPSSDDVFCKPAVIDGDAVIKGEHINIVWNYKPIGSQQEKLHFLLVPKKHRSTPLDISEEEYSEAMMFAYKLVDYFSEHRDLQEVFFVNNTGKASGQSVPHWHMHLIFLDVDTATVAGKLEVIKGRTFRSPPMEKEAIAEKVAALHHELVSQFTTPLARGD
ncbi:MAG: HIT family protein [Chlamydiota bacterium]